MTLKSLLKIASQATKVKTSLDWLHEKKELAVVSTVSAATHVLLVGSAAVLSAMSWANWWPAKKAATGFFQVGHLYRFLPNAVWYTLWEHSPSEKNEDKRNRALHRMKPGSIFMVICNEPMFPDGLKVQVSMGEMVGWIDVSGEAQYAPWTHFQPCNFAEMAKDENDHSYGDEDLED